MSDFIFCTNVFCFFFLKMFSSVNFYSSFLSFLLIKQVTLTTNRGDFFSRYNLERFVLIFACSGQVTMQTFAMNKPELPGKMIYILSLCLYTVINISSSNTISYYSLSRHKNTI